MRNAHRDPLPWLGDKIAAMASIPMLACCFAIAAVALAIYWLIALPVLAWEDYRRLDRTNATRRHDAARRF